MSLTPTAQFPHLQSMAYLFSDKKMNVKEAVGPKGWEYREDGLVLQISTKLREKSHEISLPRNQQLSHGTPITPVGGPLLWMVWIKNELPVLLFPFSKLYVDSTLETFFFQQYC